MRWRAREFPLLTLVVVLCHVCTAAVAADEGVWPAADADAGPGVAEAIPQDSNFVAPRSSVPDDAVAEESYDGPYDGAYAGAYEQPDEGGERGVEEATSSQGSAEAAGEGGWWSTADPEGSDRSAEAGVAAGDIAGAEAWSLDTAPGGLSFDDREAIGRIAYAEAGNQGEEGLAAVIYTIFNRVSSGQFQDTVQGVIDAPNQFEPATRAGGWRYLPPLSLSQRAQCESILDLILAGRLPDPTRGAVFFQNTRIVAARAAAGRGSAYLIDFGGTPPIAEIGDHRFYDFRAAANLAAARWRSTDAELEAALAAAAALPYGSGDEEAFAAVEPAADEALAVAEAPLAAETVMMPAESGEEGNLTSESGAYPENGADWSAARSPEQGEELSLADPAS